ncbi:MAG: YhdH/YhfP family quinone oxidoreductase [Pseudomonadota bacterium]|nr:YhdH/YhfP family quinone oxidoreductase [Pseudomonadota bacterium]
MNNATATYNALQTTEVRDGLFDTAIKTLAVDDLPQHALLVAVHYSSLNYKDALSLSGHRGVTRHYPHTAGIDAGGVVVASEDDRFTPGDPVIVTGYDLGMNTPGGYGEYIRIPASWAVALPDGLSLKQAMMLGTAGLTAALCVDKLQRMGLPSGGDVLVTGASGGVGSVAVALLAHLGCPVVASSGKTDQASYLRELGAKTILDRETLTDPSQKALLKERWQGAVDTVGGDTLVNVLKSLSHSASVACCGLVASANLHASLMPFILRGINLLGVDSVELPVEHKAAIWRRFANDWAGLPFDRICKEIPLSEVPTYAERILAGKMIGRALVRVRD